jgi:hypothetical protein
VHINTNIVLSYFNTEIKKSVIMSLDKDEIMDLAFLKESTESAAKEFYDGI